MRLLKIACFLSVFLGLVRCASQQPITGGERDETPPKLIGSLPKDQSLNYRGNKVVLEFDEYVMLNNLRKELLITPYTNVKYVDRLKKGRILELTLDSALDENTTYTFNFRGAVQDFNEKNPAENLKLAFSTGDYIDSLVVSGTVVDLLTGTPVENASVMLYPAGDTVTLEDGKPLYLGKSGAEGTFRIENLKPSEYQVFAIKEEDENLKYSKAEEKIGFLAKNIVLDSNRTDVELKLLNYDYKELKLIVARANKQYFDFKYNKVVKDFEMNVSDEKMAENVLAKKIGEQVRLYNPSLVATDSFEVRMRAVDSVGNEVDTTLFVQFKEPKRMADETFSVQIEPRNGKKISQGDSVQLEMVFSKPVTEIELDSVFRIFQMNDSTADTLQWNVEPALADYRTKLIFPKQAHTDTVSYVFRKGAFVSADLDTLDEQTLRYQTLDPENYGVVSGKIETWEESFVIQLLDNGKVEQEIRNQKNYRFVNVSPGKKSIRILVDEDGDGKWEKGDYKTKQLPEKVFLYRAEIGLKANWELELDLIEF